MTSEQRPSKELAALKQYHAEIVECDGHECEAMRLTRWAIEEIERLEQRVAELERVDQPTDALSEAVELLDQGKEFATVRNMRDSIVEALALISELRPAPPPAELLAMIKQPAPEPPAIPDQDVEKLAWAQRAYEDGKKYLDDGGGQMIHVRQNRALGILFAEIERLEKMVYMLPSEPPAGTLDYELPCDVRLPPNTFIGRGCKLSTLLSALKVREGQDLEFSDKPRPSVTKEGHRTLPKRDHDTPSASAPPPGAAPLSGEVPGLSGEKEPIFVPGCHRSHPHEDMNAECERLTVIARENNRVANETEPTRTEKLRAALEPDIKVTALGAGTETGDGHG